MPASYPLTQVPLYTNLRLAEIAYRLVHETTKNGLLRTFGICSNTRRRMWGQFRSESRLAREDYGPGVRTKSVLQVDTPARGTHQCQKDPDEERAKLASLDDPHKEDCCHFIPARTVCGRDTKQEHLPS